MGTLLRTSCKIICRQPENKHLRFNMRNESHLRSILCGGSILGSLTHTPVPIKIKRVIRVDLVYKDDGSYDVIVTHYTAYKEGLMHFRKYPSYISAYIIYAPLCMDGPQMTYYTLLTSTIILLGNSLHPINAFSLCISDVKN